MVQCSTSKYIKVNVADPCEVFTPTSEKGTSEQNTKVKAKVTRNVKTQSDKQKKSLKVDHLVINVGKDSNVETYEWIPKGSFVGLLIPCATLLLVLMMMIVGFDASQVITHNTSDSTKVLVYDGKHKYMTWPDPPPRSQLASVARYVIHISEWGSLATNSTHKDIEGYPFVNIFSVSDGPYNNSTGVPYFYFTPLELSVIDIEASNKVSLTVTEAQSDFCSKKEYDPEDPRCAHIILTGSIKKIEKDSEEEKFAKNALFSRHVEMKEWPAGHEWFFAKLEIIHIYLLDYFGGVATVTPEEYFAASPFGANREEFIMK